MMRSPDRDRSRPSATEPERLAKSALLRHIAHFERRLHGGIGTHAEMLALTAAEDELVRREEHRERRTADAERRTRASRRSSGEEILTF